MKFILPISFLLFAFSICDAYSQTYSSPGVYVQEVPSGAHAIAQVETAVPVFIGYSQKAIYNRKNAQNQAIEIESFAAYQKIYGGASAGYFLSESVQLFFANGGKRCLIISVGLSTSPIHRKALEQGLSISKKAKAQLLLIPDAVGLPEADFYQIQNKMLRQCADLGSQFAILNTLEPTADVQADFAQFRSHTATPDLSRGAVYYPWLINKDGKAVPPSGAIAGVYARVDHDNGVWKAPANVSLQGVQRLTDALTTSEQALGNQSPDGKSINAIVSQGKGIRVWGARTLAGNDNEWRYIPVRRFAIMVEQSVKEGLTWVVFEPNDEPLWNSAKKAVEDYLDQLYRKGALQGSKAAHAFYVKCGLRETMTASDVAQKKMILQVGLAPLRPAEFVVLRWEWNMP